jgi:hypothetical protein
MNKRIKNKKTKEKYKFYRGIMIGINSVYSWKNCRVVVFTPDIERYFKNLSGVKAFIDSFLSRYIEPDYPF